MHWWDSLLDVVDEVVPAFAQPRPLRSQILLHHGTEHLRANRYLEAVSCLRRAVEIGAHDAEAWCLLGQALAGLERMRPALRAFQKAVTLAPGNATYRFNLDHVRQALARCEAIERARGAVSLQPHNPMAHIMLGRALSDAGRLPEAALAFEAAARLSPESAEPLNHLGIVLACMQKPEQSIDVFRKAIAIDAAYPPAHYNLAKVFCDHGRWADAVGELEATVQLDARFPLAHFHLGLALANCGRYEDAVKAYQQAIAVDARDFRAHCNVGYAYYHLGRFEEAVRHTERALAIDPADEISRKNLERYRAQLQYCDSLRAEFELERAKDPDNPEPYLRLGVALHDMDRFTDAMVWYERALELQPDMWQAHMHKAQALFAIERAEEAIALLRHAIGVCAPQPELYQALGSLLLEMGGRPEEAEKAFREAIRLDPSHLSAHFHLGSLYLATERPMQALDEFNRVLELDARHARACFKMGMTLQALGRPHDAVLAYRRALELHPTHLHARNNLVHVLLQLGRTDEAEHEKSLAVRMGQALLPDAVVQAPAFVPWRWAKS
jgi:tetratricopeptide (TPR) repeat protein